MGDKAGHKFRGNQWTKGGGGGGVGTVGGVMSSRQKSKAIWDSAIKASKGSETSGVTLLKGDYARAKKKKKRTTRKQRAEQFAKDYAATPHYD